MKALGGASTLLAALLLGGCTSSHWRSTENVPGARLYVPKVYAPLLPGSIYPDKRIPLPAKARPAMVVLCPTKGNCREKEFLDLAAQRGLVVLVGREPRVDLLRTRAEADAERIGWLLVNPGEELLRRWIGVGAPDKAVAVIGPPPRAGAPTPLPSSPSKKILFAALLDREPPEANDRTILKLYSPNEEGLLPGEAFRDAVEWLTGELAAR